jgi:hypothetical protein
LIAFALGLLSWLICSTEVFGWGRIGHRVISRFAEERLTGKAKAGIAALLPLGESLADASLWADEHRREFPKTAPLHYVDAPLDEVKYDPKWSKDDPKFGCVGFQ